jgi:hypothetical protein
MNPNARGEKGGGSHREFPSLIGFFFFYIKTRKKKFQSFIAFPLNILMGSREKKRDSEMLFLKFKME